MILWKTALNLRYRHSLKVNATDLQPWAQYLQNTYRMHWYLIIFISLNHMRLKRADIWPQWCYGTPLLWYGQNYQISAHFLIQTRLIVELRNWKYFCVTTMNNLINVLPDILTHLISLCNAVDRKAKTTHYITPHPSFVLTVWKPNGSVFLLHFVALKFVY